MRKLKLVIDTNVFLVALSPKGKYHWIYQAIRKRKLELLISNEIFAEYNEVCQQRYSKVIIEELLDSILNFANVILITPSFQWRVIYNDPDDNKFVDCAVAGNADYLISNDKHFDILKQLEFPKITVLTLHEFEQLFKEQLSL